MLLNITAPEGSSCGGRQWTWPWPSCPWCPPCCRSTQWGCSRKPCVEELQNGRIKCSLKYVKSCHWTRILTIIFDNHNFYCWHFIIPDQISVPVRNILVGHSGCHVKHDDCTLALQTDIWLIDWSGNNFMQATNLDVVAIPQPTKLLLTRCVPHVEPRSKQTDKMSAWR